MTALCGLGPAEDVPTKSSLETPPQESPPQESPMVMRVKSDGEQQLHPLLASEQGEAGHDSFGSQHFRA